MDIKKIGLFTLVGLVAFSSVGLLARRYYRRPSGGFSISVGAGPRYSSYYGRRPVGWYQRRYPRYNNWPSSWWALPYLGPYIAYTAWDGERIKIRNYEELRDQMDTLERKIKRLERRLKEDLSRKEMGELRNEIKTLEGAQDRLYEVKEQLDSSNKA
ncbi:MAG: hypothetical protein UV79_C0002G0026 [candidate division TM6 bacterium GW2011_GWF2_43_17]|nr:MAG: hypothetical protein UV79_C0002G0026 [candidate division TM6 bacterium GW2011_GWF2_43_17]HAU30159.1 hypothetical protein [Candidatus Dependentiae bacterium]